MPSWRGALADWNHRADERIKNPEQKDLPVLAAKVFFPTGGHKLSADDRKVLLDLARNLRTFLIHDRRVEIIAKGYADPRAFKGYADVRDREAANQRLSVSRANAVMGALKVLLGHPKCSFSAEGLGAKGVYAAPVLWSEDRRVDVFVKLESKLAVEDKNNPFKKYRSNIFKNYHPSYSLWIQRGLEHLVDEWERVEFGGDLTISQEEVPKVLELIKQINQEEYEFAQSTINFQNPNAAAELAKVYWRVHFHEWDERVYPRYKTALLKYWDAHPEAVTGTEASTENMVRIVSSQRPH